MSLLPADESSRHISLSLRMALREYAAVLFPYSIIITAHHFRDFATNASIRRLELHS